MEGKGGKFSFIPLKKLKIDPFTGSTIRFRNPGLSEVSKASYKAGINQYLAYLTNTGQKESPESVKAWLEEVKQNSKPSTFNLRVQALKDYLLKKYENDHFQLFSIQEFFKSIKRITLERAVHEDEYLTHNEVMELCQKLTPRISLIVEALFWTGCRVTELINIKFEDIKENDKHAIIRIKSGKGNGERTVYMPLELYEKAKWFFRGKTYLFETKDNKQYNKIPLHREIRRQAARHGLNAHPHMLRHSKAMYLKNERGLSADQIAKALGHKRVSTTLESYFHGTPSAEDQGIGK